MSYVLNCINLIRFGICIIIIDGKKSICINRVTESAFCHIINLIPTVLRGVQHRRFSIICRWMPSDHYLIFSVPLYTVLKK